MPIGTQLWHDGQLRYAAVAAAGPGFGVRGMETPDRILGHSGWGETLGLSAIWPDVPQILWPELWMRPGHGGYGVDPFKPKVTLEAS